MPATAVKTYGTFTDSTLSSLKNLKIVEEEESKERRKSVFGTQRVKLCYARSETSGKLVHIKDASSGVDYLCPICGKPVFPRRGKNREWYFCHYRNELCEPERDLLAGFIREITAQELADHHRILVPGPCYRLKGCTGFTLNDPFVLNFELTEEPHEVAGNGGPVIQLRGQADGVSYAFFISTAALPPYKAVCSFQRDRVETLLIDAFDLTLTHKDLIGAADELLFEKKEGKKWITSPYFPASAERLRRILPSGAFAPHENCRACTRDHRCEHCTYGLREGDDFLCCFEYAAADPRRLGNCTGLPQPLKDMDNYKARLITAKKESRNSRSCTKTFKKIFETLFSNTPNPEGGLCFSGTAGEDLSGVKHGSGIYWGIGRGGAPTVLVEPEGGGEAVRTILRLESIRDYATGESYEYITGFRSETGEAPRDEALDSSAKLKTRGATWWEIDGTSRLGFLVGKLAEIVGEMKWCFPEIHRRVLEHIEELRRNGYRENTVNPALPRNCCTAAWQKSERSGKCVFYITGEGTGEIGRKGYGMIWDLDRKNGAPMNFFEVKPEELRNFYRSGNGAREIKPQTFLDAFNLAVDLCSADGWNGAGGRAFPGGLSEETLASTTLGQAVLEWSADQKKAGKTGGLAGFLKAAEGRADTEKILSHLTTGQRPWTDLADFWNSVAGLEEILGRDAFQVFLSDFTIG